MSGGTGIRTPDPLHAMQVLYQLSYTPKGLPMLPVVMNSPNSKCAAIDEFRVTRSLSQNGASVSIIATSLRRALRERNQ